MLTMQIPNDEWKKYFQMSENVQILNTGPKYYFHSFFGMYFVIEIVLTYCEKYVLVFEKNF